MDYHLAQINIARMLAPLDDPLMFGFVSQLARINSLADTAPGFVWRLQTETGDATALRVFDDDWLIVNLTVWQSTEALFDFTYRTQHAEIMRHRREWFERLDTFHMALWWIQAGHIPSASEAKGHLEHIQAYGPTATAFTFKERYDSPAELRD